MAGIDNTVIFEILLRLQPHKVNNSKLYRDLLLLPPSYNSTEGNAAERYAERMKHGEGPRGKKTVFWPKQKTWVSRIQQADEEKKTAFWKVLNTEEKQKIQRFPLLGQNQVSFASHLYDVLLEQIRGRRDALEKIETLCREWQIPEELRAELKFHSASPEDLTYFLVKTAYAASTETGKTETQMSRKDRLPPAPPPAESAPSALPTARLLPLLADGMAFAGTHPDPRFPVREDHSKEPLSPWYYEFSIDGTKIFLPYREVLGQGKPGGQEYVEGKNLWIGYVEQTADIKNHVPSLDYPTEFQREVEQAARLHYTRHPPKLWLVRGEEWRDKGELTLTFGKIGYIDHRIYRKELAAGGAEALAFQKAATAARGWDPALNDCLWAACGGGCWVITADGFLVLSCRSDALVAEVPGKLSYSASGSYDRYRDKNPNHGDNTPGGAMAAELREELGLPEPRPEDLTLMNLGIDLARYLSQLSYVWRCPYTADMVRQYRKEGEAVDANEQKILFVPFEKKACGDFLRCYEFEPGAAASLRRLLEKEFGPW